MNLSDAPKRKIGVIGFGNMGQAIVKGILKSGSYEVSVSNRSEEKLNFAREWGAKVTSNLELAKESDVLFLAVKPYVYPEVIEEIKEGRNKEGIVVSIAGNWSLSMLEDALPGSKVVRAMPNTPSLIGKGMTALVANERMSEAEYEMVEDLFQTFSTVIRLDEELFPGFTAVSGALPATIFLMMEALADAALKEGLPRDIAFYSMAHAIKGSAELYLETKKHPMILKDMVTTPRGSTIEGLLQLEKGGFKSAIHEAVKAVSEKSREV
ncbi:pyrroline-5-carboxylate reductase [Guggenheimella bovis]